MMRNSAAMTHAMTAALTITPPTIAPTGALEFVATVVGEDVADVEIGEDEVGDVIG